MIDPKEYEERFAVDCEAFIIHRDNLSVIAISDPHGLPWRACVKVGGFMHWQWCKTLHEAKAWIGKWRKA